MTHNKLPLVFLDISIDGDPAERMVFKLFSDIVPKTAENFRTLCTGENGVGVMTGKPLHYKGSIFHRIVKGSLAEGGDISNRDGSGGESIYGDVFEDESFSLKHKGPGYLSMSNTGANKNGSRFFITFKAAPHLDGSHVVFGKLVTGRETLKKIERVGSEKGEPAFLVKVVNCGEYLESKKRAKKKHFRGKSRKKRRRYSTSESDSLSDSDSDLSDSDSDSYSSSSYISSSSDDRRRKRKRSYKRDKYKHGKRRDKRREKLRKRRDKRSRRKSKRILESSSTDCESTSGSMSEDDQAGARALLPQPPSVRVSKNSSHPTSEKQTPPLLEKNPNALLPEKEVITDLVEKGGEAPRENGTLRSNGVETETQSNKSADKSDFLADLPQKSRGQSRSSKRSVSKSMSNSPRRVFSKSPSVRRGSISRSVTPRRVSRSPEHMLQERRSMSRSRSRSLSRSPDRKSVRSRGSNRSRSLVRSVSRSPSPISPGSKHKSRISRSPAPPLGSVSRSPVRSLSRSRSRSLPRSPSRSISVSPVKALSTSQSPVKVSKRSISRSPSRRTSRRSISRSPRRGRSRRSITRSPLRRPGRNRRPSYSRSPVSPGHKGRSPLPSRGRSLSRSISPDGSPKRIRRGRGFSQRYSYARRYRTPTPDRSPARLHRYSGRNERDRYSSYRNYADRSSRHYRSPLRGRTPPRYRSRRSWTRSPSASRSPIRYRSRGKARYSRSPLRSRSPVEKSRFRGSLKSEKRRSPSRSASRSRSPDSRSSSDSPSPKRTSKDISRSVSGSPAGKGLVSYGDGSPDSGQR